LEREPGFALNQTRRAAGSYYLTAARDAGSPPVSAESGEIILKLDWRQLAGGNSYNTYQIASAVVRRWERTECASII
jgi:hypothetical protein